MIWAYEICVPEGDAASDRGFASCRCDCKFMAVTAKPSLGLVDPLGVTAIPLSFTGCNGAGMGFEASVIGSSGAFGNGSTATVEATLVAPVGATVTITVTEVG